MDGANIEIRKEIGPENMFIFGAEAHEIADLRKKVEEQTIVMDSRLRRVLDAIAEGQFGNAQEFDPIQNVFRYGHDYYLLAYDFPSYVEAQNRVDQCFLNNYEWTRKSIMSVAGSGKFSSDRTIKQYAEQIWNIKPVRRPGPVSISVERLSHMGVVSRDVITPMGASPSNSISLERMTPNMNHTSHFSRSTGF